MYNFSCLGLTLCLFNCTCLCHICLLVSLAISLHPCSQPSLQTLITLPVCIVDISWIVLKGDGKVLLEDEVEDHHHLHRSLDAPADAVAHLYNNKPLDEDKDMQGINTEMGFPPHKKKILSSVLQNGSTAPNGIRENLCGTFGAKKS